MYVELSDRGLVIFLMSYGLMTKDLMSYDTITFYSVTDHAIYHTSQLNRKVVLSLLEHYRNDLIVKILKQLKELWEYKSFNINEIHRLLKFWYDIIKVILIPKTTTLVK